MVPPPPPPLSLLLLAAALALALAAAAPAAAAAAAAADRSLHVALHAPWAPPSAPADALWQLSRAATPAAATAYLSRLCELRAASPPAPPPSVSLALALDALPPPLRHAPIARAAHAWQLAAGTRSPPLAAHAAAARAVLSLFAPGPSPGPVPPVFFVLAPSNLTRATLVLHPAHPHRCPRCPAVAAEAPLSVLQSHASEIVLSPHPDAPHLLFVFADVAAPAFCRALPDVLRAANDTRHRVVLRLWDTQPAAHGLPLQAFAVRLTLKSTEYKVVDDRVFRTKLFADCPYAQPNCTLPAVPAPSHLVRWVHQHQPPSFTASHVLRFLLRPAASAADAPTVLRRLRLFAEDTPAVVRSPRFRDAPNVNASLEKTLHRSISRMRRAVDRNQYLFINGRSFPPSSLLHASHKLFRCLACISTAAAYAPHLFVPRAQRSALYAALHAERAEPYPSLRVDMRLDLLAPNALVRLNDLSADTRYSKWHGLDVASAEDVQRFIGAVRQKTAAKPATSKSQLHTDLVNVKADHLSMLLVVDPGDMQQVAFLSLPQSIIQAGFPVHVSVLLVPNGHTSSLIAAGFHYLLRLKGRRTAVKFLSMILQVLEYVAAYKPNALDADLVEISFSQVVGKLDSDYASAAEVLDQDQQVRSILDESARYAESMNLFSDADQGDSREQQPSVIEGEERSGRKLSFLCVLNGIVVNDVGADVIPLALKEQQRIAKLLADDGSASAIRNAQRSFDRWVSVDPSLIVVRRLGRGLRTKERRTRVTTSDDVLPPMTAGSLFAVRDSLATIGYIPSASQSDRHTMTVWLAAIDHTLPEFIRAKQMLLDLASSEVLTKIRARVAVLDQHSRVSHEVLGCFTAFACLEFPVIMINGKRVVSSLFLEKDDLVIELASHVDDADISDLKDDDMGLLHRLQVNEVSAACEESVGLAENGASYSVVKAAVKEHAHEALTYFQNPRDDKQPDTPLSVLAVVDPLHPEAYIIASFLEELRSTFDSDMLSMQMVLAPQSGELKKEQEFTDTFQKFVLQGRPVFQEDSEGRIPARASFFSLPQDSVLTVAVEPPRAWFVSSYATNYDMDNVILKALPEDIMELHAEYELKNLIVEGSCVDEEESPPQGLKLYLENDNGVSVDTLVMANLGYFQLKVPTPGRWNLRLAPGRSSKIFSLVRMEMYKDLTKTTYMAGTDGRVAIPVESFDGAGGILLRVKRNAGMEGVSLLNGGDGNDELEESSSAVGVLGRLKASMTSVYSRISMPKPNPSSTIAGAAATYDTIHVFSVASGHLYERFLKIMITSVTKHASRPVKFWLLENYLSPSFKKVLPLFAKKHGAEVGMVTYRWPGWLRAQTEKQRIIWAYKILFLDVLFPLDVGRIIFVDSDQVIRGDLAELMDIDLKGAPYGYVPFCDSREEVEGYRFWKTGFWKDTLRGAKYRISALYVVDLNRFRETAAGDTLRSVYQGLSADPNSLSNLDQDLPNYASTMSSIGGVVPIFDLPEEWLWCESWCDDESKARAKAIDLCNNPMTKEPKLSSAKRIISEWVEYDNAASELTEELYLYLQSQSTSNSMPENVTCEASPPNSLHGKPGLPLADIQIKEEL